MGRPGATFAALLFAASISAQSLPELFQKAKAQVKGESWTEALKTLDALDAEAARPGNEAARRQLAAPTAFYRGVCEANLGNASRRRRRTSRRFSTLQPRRVDGPLDVLEEGDRGLPGRAQEPGRGRPPSSESDGRPAMFVAFQEFKLPPNSGEPVNEKWGDGPVQWIMTSEEKRTWAGLASGGEWQEFVDKFWEARNPQPGQSGQLLQDGLRPAGRLRGREVRCSPRGHGAA